MASPSLSSRERQGPDLYFITLDGPVPGHTQPGQFTQLSIGGLGPAYFAIATPPGEPAGFLVKAHGDVAEALIQAEIGTAIDVAQAIGNGFGLPDGEEHLVAVATGTGIAAVLPLLEAHPGRQRTLVWGVRTEGHAVLTPRVEALAADGVQIHKVLSRPGEGDGEYVQQAMPRLNLLSPDVRVILCGQKDMAQSIKDQGAEAGMHVELFHSNF